MVADIDGFLPDSAFLLDVPATDWKDAIRLAGKGLVAAGFTTDAYTDQMIETVEKMGPYIVIAPGLALAPVRGRAEDRPELGAPVHAGEVRQQGQRPGIAGHRSGRS